MTAISWRVLVAVAWMLSLAHAGPAVMKSLDELVGVWRADFNHDASRVVVEMRGGHLGIWDVATGMPVTGDLGSLTVKGSYVMEPEAKRVLVAVDSGKSRLFDMATAMAVSPEMEVAFTWSWTDRVIFTPDGQQVLFIKDGACRVLDLISGKEVARIALATGGEDQEVRPDVAFSADGKVAMILDGTAVLRRFDTDGWKDSGVAMPHPERECWHAGFAMSADAKHAITFDYPGENGPSGCLQLWDAEKGKELGMPLSAVNGMGGEFFDDGRRLLVVPGRGRTRVVDVPDFEKAIELPMHDDLDAGRGTVTRDGRRVLTWGHDMRVAATDITTGKTSDYQTGRAHVTDVLVGPDPASAWLVLDNTAFNLLGHHDYYVFRLRLLDMKPVATARFTKFLHRAILSSDGTRLMVHEGGTNRERIRVFDAMTLAELTPDGRAAQPAGSGSPDAGD